MLLTENHTRWCFEQLRLENDPGKYEPLLLKRNVILRENCPNMEAFLVRIFQC